MVVAKAFNYGYPLHTVRIVQGVSNAHCAYRSLVQWFDCINFVRATDHACVVEGFL